MAGPFWLHALARQGELGTRAQLASRDLRRRRLRLRYPFGGAIESPTPEAILSWRQRRRAAEAASLLFLSSDALWHHDISVVNPHTRRPSGSSSEQTSLATNHRLAIGIVTILREVLFHQRIKLRLREPAHDRELMHIEISHLPEQQPAYCGLHHKGIGDHPNLFFLLAHTLPSLKFKDYRFCRVLSGEELCHRLLGRGSAKPPGGGGPILTSPSRMSVPGPVQQFCTPRQYDRAFAQSSPLCVLMQASSN